MQFQDNGKPRAVNVEMSDGGKFTIKNEKAAERNRGRVDDSPGTTPPRKATSSIIIIRSSSEESKPKFQERDDLPTDRELLMAARAEGRNAETLTAYQKKVRSLEALERKLQRQMDALEDKKKEAQEAAAELGKAEGEKAFGGFAGYAEREEKASKSKALRETVKNMREEIRETEKRIKQAEAGLADVEKTPEMQEETEKALADWRNANPHDAAKVIQELLQEQDTQKRYIDLLRRTDARVKSADVSALASTLLKENESSADIKSIEARLQRLGDYIVNH